MAGGADCYPPLAADRLRRQRSLPAAVVASFAPCAGGEARSSLGKARSSLGNARLLGGKAGVGYLVDGEEQGEFGRRGGRQAGGGVGYAVRALWTHVLRRVASWGGSSSSAKEQYYGHEEYAQNFDEGAAAGEPENLPRSFSARYSRRRPAEALSDVARRRHLHPAHE